MVILLLPSLLLIFTSLIFASQLSAFLEIPSDRSYWIPLAAGIAFLSIYIEILFTYVVVEQKPVLYAKFTIRKFLLEISLTIIFISFFKMSWEGRLLSRLLTTIIGFLITFLFFFKKGLLNFQIKKTYILAAISFCLPLVMHTLGNFIINQSDRIFIAKLVNIGEVASTTLVISLD